MHISKPLAEYFRFPSAPSLRSVGASVRLKPMRGRAAWLRAHRGGLGRFLLLGVLVSTGCREIYFPTHPDDDLLFMNPDIRDGFAAGHEVTIVYLTSGDRNGSLSIALKREEGVRRAYTRMIGGDATDSQWSSSLQTTVNGKPVDRWTHPGAPDLQLYFMRLPNDSEGLVKLWKGTTPTIAKLAEPQVTYTREELIDALAGFIDRTSANRVGTQDSTRSYGSYEDASTHLSQYDHREHHYGALFVLAGQARASGLSEVKTYRGYNIYFDEENLATDVHLDKWHDMLEYCPGNETGCYVGSAFHDDTEKHYSSTAQTGREGPLRGAQGCLTGGTRFGVRYGSCAEGVAQTWRFEPDGEIRHLASQECLMPHGPSLVLGGCGAASRGWMLTSNGLVRWRPNGQCLIASVTLHLQTCSGIEVGGNRFDVPAEQRWSFEMTGGLWSTAFSANQVASVQSQWGSFRLGDVDGDGKGDACIRLSSGVHCARGTGSGFGPLHLWSNAFSDINGWGPSAYGATLMLGDIDRDGDDDVCARGFAGLWCALSDGEKFLTPTIVNTSFSNAQGWSTSEARWGSLDMGDIDGDGDDDVCGRTHDGIHCAIAENGTLGNATPWFSEDFTDQRGWGHAYYGGTIQLGDIDGDGRADICGRGAASIFCAVSTGTAFRDFSRRAFRQDFSNDSGWLSRRSRWGSVVLANVSGDYFADVCGRDADGLTCGISQRTHFDAAVRTTRRFFTDPSFLEGRYGGTLQAYDLDGDGKDDMCALASEGLVCARSP